MGLEFEQEIRYDFGGGRCRAGTVSYVIKGYISLGGLLEPLYLQTGVLS